MFIKILYYTSHESLELKKDPHIILLNKYNKAMQNLVVNKQSGYLDELTCAF